jgi:hypothetical protein
LGGLQAVKQEMTPMNEVAKKALVSLLFMNFAADFINWGFGA